eukprot:jgi/Hompol1/5451/HPOL_001702-RA
MTEAFTPRPPKPDQAKHDQAAIQAKIPPKTANDPASASPKDALRETLTAQMQAMKDLSEQRKKLFDEITATQAILKKKLETARGEKEKLGFKNVEEIDRQINSIESQVSSGALSATEERRALNEISSLKKARKVLEGHGSQQTSVEADRAKIDALRAQMKAIETQRDAAREATDATRAQLNTLTESLKESRSVVTSLLEEKKNAKALVDAAFEKLRTTRAAFKAAKDTYYAWEQEERNKRREAQRQRQMEEREARLVAQAERELEDADIPAFVEEINLCTALIQFLNTQINGNTETKTAAPSRPTSGRVVSAEDAMPKGATVLQRKSDREDEFMVVSKKKNNNSTPKKNAVDAGTSSPAKSARPIKLDIKMVEQFISLQITIPVSTDDIPSTLAVLEEKKKNFCGGACSKLRTVVDVIAKKSL